MIGEFKKYIRELRSQDWFFKLACIYIILSYLRPQVIFPWLDILPWSQLVILSGLLGLAVKSRLKMKPVILVMFGFCLSVYTSSILSYAPEHSLNKADVVLIWALELLFFISCISSAKQVRLILILFFIVLFKMSLFGAKTWISRGFGFTKWGIAGPTGFFANSGEYSLLMAILACMSLAFLLSVKARWIYYILPLTAVFSVLGASSRGGQLALLIGFVYLLFMFGKLRIKYILISFVAIWSAYQLLPEEQKERFNIVGDDATSVSRLNYWKSGLDMMENHPWFGIGHDAFPLYYRDYYKSQLDGLSGYLYQRIEVSHNSFVQVGSTLGIFGLLFYLSLIVLHFKNNIAVRKEVSKNQRSFAWVRATTIGLDSAMVVYLVGSMFMSIAFYPYIYFLLMFSQSMKDNIKAS